MQGKFNIPSNQYSAHCFSHQTSMCLCGDLENYRRVEKISMLDTQIVFQIDSYKVYQFVIGLIVTQLGSNSLEKPV